MPFITWEPLSTDLTHQPRRYPQSLAALDPVERRVANEPARVADFVHDIITSIDARGAVYAFHLGSITDVDTGRTNAHALEAINAIAQTFTAAMVGLLATVQVSAVATLFL